MPEEMGGRFDGSPELPGSTESEQMYLLTIARAAEEGVAGPLPITSLAAALGVSAVSANEKVHKLEERGLVEYSPYKGVQLTDLGGRLAHRVLRTRRLWSAFLARDLGYGPAEADALACSLEHVTPAETAERLAAYLGDPRTGPLGQPIPPAGGAAGGRAAVPLSEVPVGAEAEILALPPDEGQAAFLAAESLIPGAVVVVQAAGGSGWLLESRGRWVHLARPLAESVLVTTRGPRHAPG